nr:hypothetical protein [Paenibacillus sp. P3E]
MHAWRTMRYREEQFTLPRGLQEQSIQDVGIMEKVYRLGRL